MTDLKHIHHWISGLQWFFFIFANIIIIPITVGEAFLLSPEIKVASIQLSFIVTGLACLAQVLLGHGRPILEGQSGLWWGIFLTLVMTTTSQGMPLHVLGGSLALGIIISGIITIVVGLFGLGPMIAKWFNDAVMGVFMLLLGVTLIQIFLKGMLGISFGLEGQATINIPIALLAIVIALFVMVISIKSPAKIRSYALLIGMIVGWILFKFIFPNEAGVSSHQAEYNVFPLGTLTWDTGVVLTAILAGLLNLSNTFGSLKGSDNLFKQKTTNKQYASSLSITGISTVVAGMFGLVPYAPYVSSIGFLQQTNIYDRLPFIIGSSLFLAMGIIQPVGAFFSMLPLSIGSAVLFVAYLQLFHSSWRFLKKVNLNALNVYRVAIPLFVGIIIMTFPASYFESIPAFIRPFLSNGLLVGILIAMVLENMINWDRVGMTIYKE